MDLTGMSDADVQHAVHFSTGLVDRGEGDQVGLLEGVRSRFGRTYAGEPDKIADELAADEAVLAADTVLFTVPNQLGVEYNARILDTIARHIAPAIGWRPAGAATAS
jgi:alkanesulfonate monooxygenase SsuD/methylene tetrahydromethanopterin reductase-like flavin-dependent oxidoreductase (luciferase family)